MTDPWITVLAGMQLAALALLVRAVLHLRRDSADVERRQQQLERIEQAGERAGRTLHDELRQQREENAEAARQQRQELAGGFRAFGDSVRQTLSDLAALEKSQLESFGSRLAAFVQDSAARNDSAREALLAALARLGEANEKRQEVLRATVESRLQGLQQDNARQLDLMRQTVDEKLQGTLERRLGDSFRQVSERLEQVHKGLGEMHSLATGVGDLKRVLGNVKTRGTWGEVQLGVLLEQVLHPDQFVVNAACRDGGERVEFAIRLPGQGGAGDDGAVLLPIDAKFPIEDYQRLLEAQDRADTEGVENAAKQLEARVRACAADIARKYINPPVTTDFAVLFLPIEGLFAEAIRRGGLPERLQREHRVVLAGPTTLWSILSSLQMGFRTLAIQKRSSEVWNLLGAVKTEWSKYGDVLDAVQKRIHQASETIDKVRVRSRAVGRRLRDVQELPLEGAAALLDGGAVVDEEGDDPDEP